MPDLLFPGTTLFRTLHVARRDRKQLGKHGCGSWLSPPVSADAEGADRARSAREEFLYRRLQSLTETHGRFCLNAKLPIPFDGHGELEVDLLCAVVRVGR
jgi:hypothetical protein